MPIDEEKLISKKEVLEKTGISYGQLYRWKRKGLIPESWFFRRSTFTGQETFFPRDKIIERIEQIKRMKQVRPLDDLAEMITEKVNAKLQVGLERLRELGWLDDSILKSFDIKKERLDDRYKSLSLTQKVDYLLNQHALYEADGFDLLAIGAKWTEGCYCQANYTLKTLLRSGWVCAGFRRVPGPLDREVVLALFPNIPYQIHCPANSWNGIRFPR
jgi:DNA-binding transcriptional MerR regulator